MQLFRGAELASSTRALDDSGLELEKVELRASQLLQELHTSMGQLKLNQAYRDKSELPFEVVLTHNQQAPASRAVMRLNRTDQGWRAQIDAIVDVQPDQVNPIFFDIPRALGEPWKLTLLFCCGHPPIAIALSYGALPSQLGPGPAHISFAVRLPVTGASQAITIPDIRMLGVSTPRPVVALPR